MVNKIEIDGKVAVLYSPGYGAGWASWNDKYKEQLCMDAEIVQAVLDGDIPKAIYIAEGKYPDIYVGGAKDIKVGWVPKGEQFEIDEYDGYESINIIGRNKYMTA